MSDSRIVEERPCPECGRFHYTSLLRKGGDPESSIAYCYVGGSRIVLEPDEQIEVIWKVRPVRVGQPRPYADSVYESEIELDGHWYTGRPDFGREVVKQAVGVLVHPFAGEKDEPRGWHESWLDSLEKVAPHTWRAVVISPYLD